MSQVEGSRLEGSCGPSTLLEGSHRDKDLVQTAVEVGKIGSLVFLLLENTASTLQFPSASQEQPRFPGQRSTSPDFQVFWPLTLPSP